MRRISKIMAAARRHALANGSRCRSGFAATRDARQIDAGRGRAAPTAQTKTQPLEDET